MRVCSVPARTGPGTHQMNLLAGAALTNTVVLLLTWTSCFPLVKNTDDAGIRAVILGVDALTLTML